MEGEGSGGGPEVELISLRAADEAAIEVVVEVGGEGSRCTAPSSLPGGGILRRFVQRTRAADLCPADLRRLEAQQGQYLSHRDASPQLAIVDAGHGRREEGH